MSKLLRVHLRFSFAAVMAIGIVVATATVAQAITKNWTGGSGNWSPGNWSPAGVPSAMDPVNIVFNDATSRTVTLNTSTPGLGLVSIDNDGTGTSTLSIPTANDLTAAAIAVGGYTGSAFTNGQGAMIHSAGTTTISPGGDLILGWGAGSTGTYTLDGGAVTANQAEFIGYSGTGTFHHYAGTNTINPSALGFLSVGHNAGSTGTYNLSGTGSLVSNESEIIGFSGTGFFNQTGGSNTVAGGLVVGYNSASTGTYNQTGGTFYAGSQVSLGSVGGSAGNLIVDGPGTSFSNNGNLVIGEFGSGSLVISRGAMVSTNDGDGYVGFGVESNSQATVRDPGSIWEISDDLNIGNVGSGTVDIQNQGSVHVGDILNIYSAGSVNLSGGTLRINSISGTGGLSKLNYSSGTMQLGGNRTIGSPSGDPIITNFFGTAPVINAGKGLAVEGTATLLTTVTLNGGTFTAGSLANASNLVLQHGTLNVTNQALAIGPSGPLGSTLDVNDDMAISAEYGISNQGLITGDGQIGGGTFPFVNDSTGELRAEPGKSLTITGFNGITNAGQISLLGGALDVTNQLRNNAGALISGNGSITAGAGTVNNGTMNFAGTANIVGNITNAAGARIISAGGGATIFFDDVVNNGEIRTSTNGFTVFFGSASGSGTYTGTGTVNFEGDLSPGSSPAAVNFAGDVVLGPDATLLIELGGTTPGSQYDQINVAGELTLDGTLAISLINGFTPTAGQTFDILNWGSLAGAFSSIELPTIPGLTWNTAQLAAGMLSVAIPGDFNNDGTVDAADYVVWRKNPGGIYTQNDFNLWRAHFGQTSGSGSGATGGVPSGSSANPTIPEPSSLLLLALSISTLLARPGGHVLRNLVSPSHPPTGPCKFQSLH